MRHLWRSWTQQLLIGVLVTQTTATMAAHDEVLKNAFTNSAYEASIEDGLSPDADANADANANAIDLGVDALRRASPKRCTVSPVGVGTSSSQEARHVDTCGYCCWTPSCLRWFATGRSFVFFCSLLSLAEAGLTIGYISSVVTSIEQHFNFNSTLTGGYYGLPGLDSF